jgi:hypothetical protein
MTPPIENSPLRKSADRPWRARVPLALLGTLALLTAPLHAGDTTMSLVGSWKFHNGSEYPGAEGSLETSDAALILRYDFSNGGSYVTAIGECDIPDRTTVLVVKMKGPAVPAVKLTDATGQSFIYRLGKLGETEETLPIDLLRPNQVFGGAEDRWSAKSPFRRRIPDDLSSRFCVGSRHRRVSNRRRLE